MTSGRGGGKDNEGEEGGSDAEAEEEESDGLDEDALRDLTTDEAIQKVGRPLYRAPSFCRDCCLILLSVLPFFLRVS